MTTLIRIQDTTNWGCEYTAADLTAYEEAVVEEVSALYPGAVVDLTTENRYDCRVIVTTRDEDGRIDASWETVRAEAEIEEAVRLARQDVWDRGEFWTAVDS